MVKVIDSMSKGVLLKLKDCLLYLRSVMRIATL